MSYRLKYRCGELQIYILIRDSNFVQYIQRDIYDYISVAFVEKKYGKAEDIGKLHCCLMIRMYFFTEYTVIDHTVSTPGRALLR